MAAADRRTHHLDLSAPPRNEADDGSHQHRLASTGSADQAEDLASAHIQRQMVDHDMLPEADHEVADTNRKLRDYFLHRHIPIDAKKTANRPSSTITRKIDFTTEVVVCLPSDFRASLDLKAFAAGDNADYQRHEWRLDHADLEAGHGYGVMQPRDKDRRSHAAIEPCHQTATIECRHRSDEGENR